MKILSQPTSCWTKVQRRPAEAAERRARAVAHVLIAFRAPPLRSMLPASASAGGAGKIRRPGAGLKAGADTKAGAKITKLEVMCGCTTGTHSGVLMCFARAGVHQEARLHGRVSFTRI